MQELDGLDKTDFLVYPNPANDWLQIAGDLKNKTIVIKDVKQQILLTQSAMDDATTIDISSLPSGMYTLQVLEREKMISYFYRFIKIK